MILLPTYHKGVGLLDTDMFSLQVVLKKMTAAFGYAYFANALFNNNFKVDITQMYWTISTVAGFSYC